jgi:putative membrane protein
MNIQTLIYAFMLSTALAGMASAQVPALEQGRTSLGGSTADAKSQLNSDDKKFFEKAATSGLSEVKAGELAAESGSDPSVKAFGKHMVEDHQKVNQDLVRLAQSKGVTLPMTLDKSHQEDLDKLKEKTGPDFDKAYAKGQIDDHEDAVDLFKKAAKSKDNDISAFASANLSTLQMHLQMAKDLKKKLKG